MVLCRGQEAAFIGRGELGAQDGTGVARACRGRHGDVRERRLAGQGSNGRGARGSREVWACRCRSGASREGVCRPGWSLCAHARKLFDSRAHDMFPKNAARGGGPGARGRVGEHLGSKGKLQDVLARGFGAGLEQVSMGVAISMP